MKIKILSCDEMNFENGDKSYKITGIVSLENVVENAIQICFVKTPCLVGQEYNVKLVASTDMKTLKCKILDLVKDSNKGIFNK